MERKTLIGWLGTGLDGTATWGGVELFDCVPYGDGGEPDAEGGAERFTFTYVRSLAGGWGTISEGWAL